MKNIMTEDVLLKQPENLDLNPINKAPLEQFYHSGPQRQSLLQRRVIHYQFSLIYREDHLYD